jgi:flagellar assembly protein FliH
MSRRSLGGADPAATFGNGSPDPFGGVVPGSRPATAPASDILIRGEAAARAKRIDLVAGVTANPLSAVGPWAEQLDDAREAAYTSAFEEGRREGLAAGLEEGRGLAREEQVALAAAVHKVLEELGDRCEDLGRQLAAQTAELALEIAQAVLNREVAAADDPGAEAIARCLDLVPSAGCLVARLNPDDAARLGEVPGLGARELVVAADPALSSGDAIVSIDQITVDARLGEALRRVGEALR